MVGDGNAIKEGGTPYTYTTYSKSTHIEIPLKYFPATNPMVGVAYIKPDEMDKEIYNSDTIYSKHIVTTK